jgi:DNA-binding IclR family transcriptional regulator
MAENIVERAFRLIEVLARSATGLGLTQLANEAAIPKTATHRLVTELVRLRYVRQDLDTSRYHLSMRLLSLGSMHLGISGVIDLAQPILDRLARESGELARLSVIDGDRLMWVAKAQGARSGLRYDPDMGQEVTLFCTATGHAWLASVSDERALEIVASQGFGRFDEFGPNAPRTISRLQEMLSVTRERGFATVFESAATGTAAIAAVVRHARTDQPIGTVSITGPSSRMGETRMQNLAPHVVAAAREMSEASICSRLLADDASRAISSAR